jgi:hypothetical protein
LGVQEASGGVQDHPRRIETIPGADDTFSTDHLYLLLRGRGITSAGDNGSLEEFLIYLMIK